VVERKKKGIRADERGDEQGLGFAAVGDKTTKRSKKFHRNCPVKGGLRNAVAPQAMEDRGGKREISINAVGDDTKGFMLLGSVQCAMLLHIQSKQGERS